MQRLLAILALLALTSSGCFGGGDSHKGLDGVTCPDGTKLTGAQVEEAPDHHAAGFNATSACPEPPSVALTGLPAQMPAYATASFNWTLDNGSVARGHSMLASLRWSAQSVADSDLTAMEVYPQELVKREHQDVPAKFTGKLTFTAPGTVYIRGYAQIQGEQYERREFWSDEVVLVITPIEPTGVVKDIVYGIGDYAGNLTREVSLMLGDGLRLKNDDLREHACTSNDDGNPGNLTAGAQAAGTPIIVRKPGTFKYTCNGVQSRDVTVRATVPA